MILLGFTKYKRKEQEPNTPAELYCLHPSKCWVYIAGADTTLEAGESAEIVIPTDNQQMSVVINIRLNSDGDIRLLTSDEAFLTRINLDFTAKNNREDAYRSHLLQVRRT